MQPICAHGCGYTAPVDRPFPRTTEDAPADPTATSESGAESQAAAPPRVLALDVGNRRIGLALTDPLGYTVQPLFTLHRTTPRADLKSIARVVRRHHVAEIVVGNPLHLSGERSAQAVKSLRFAEELRGLVEVPVHLWDERLTTAEAHAQLDAREGVRKGASDRKDRSAIIDQLAAVLLLESFLAERAYRLAAARLRAGETG